MAHSQRSSGRAAQTASCGTISPRGLTSSFGLCCGASGGFCSARLLACSPAEFAGPKSTGPAWTPGAPTAARCSVVWSLERPASTVIGCLESSTNAVGLAECFDAEWLDEILGSSLV